MIDAYKISVLLISILGFVTSAGAAESVVQRDSDAVEVLQDMGAYIASLDKVVIKSSAFSDARLPAGLTVSESSQIVLTIDRPGSMHISNDDGLEEKQLFFHDGLLTVFTSPRNFYAQARVPSDIEEAARYALEEIEVEAPLMDMVYQDVAEHLLGSGASILYISGYSRVAGTDCHHIVIRDEEADIQLWIEQGERPLPRKIMITSKWESGSPRFVANMIWDSTGSFDPELFEFTPPAGAIDIGFVRDDANPTVPAGE